MKLAWFLLLLSSVSYAQEILCIDRLLPIPRPSATHQLAYNDWTGAPGALNSDSAKLALEALVFEKLFCESSDIEFSTTVNCQQLDPNRITSTTCYSASSLGQFVLTKDGAQNVNIIFHRSTSL
jgi:hypothetical protein